MEGINILIDRIQKFGYKYKSGFFDDQDVPPGIAHKTFYIHPAPANDGSPELDLSSTVNVQTIREEFTVYLLDLQKKTNLNQFINDRNQVVSEVLKNRGADRIPGVVKIQVDNIRNGDTESYLISQMNVVFTEILS